MMNSNTLFKQVVQNCKAVCSNRFGNWSPLAVAFNTKPHPKLNLKVLKNAPGLFDVPELTSHEGFYALQTSCVARTDQLIEEATNPRRTRKMVEIFDELSDTLCKVADLAEFIRVAHPSAEYAHSAEIACSTASSIVEKLNTHRNLYKALKEVATSGDVVATTDVDRHVANLFLFDFEQCGIHLSEQERCTVVNLNDTILHLGQHFVTGTAKPRLVNRKFLPEELKHMLPNVNNNIVISGLFSDSSNPLVREMAFKIFLHPEEHQDYLLSRLLEARNELAQVCGFHTYSERALRDSTMETPSTVMEFLDTLSEQLRSRADEDFRVMSGMKKAENPNSGALAVWDVPYFTHTAKKVFFNFSSSDFSPYFSLGACMEGLNDLFSRLYGITLVNEEMCTGESWCTEVYKIAVVHETEGILGHIYCDFYERDGKPKQDCHFTIRGGKFLPDGDYQNPVVVIMLNFTPPRWSRPALLTPGMVDNLFHEMGHAMHSMLGRTAYQHITGTRCSTDFAEVPSVLMEYFASDPRVLKTFAKHFQTNEPMPEDMLKSLCASKRLFTASETQVQLFYSALDQTYHGKHPLKGSTTEVLAETQERYYSLPYVPNTCWQLRFSHLVGYGAKYYSYLVSRALASWIWQSYFAEDPFCRERGERYRRECLAYGGGKPPQQLVTEFLKRQPTPVQLTDSLIKEIDCSQESSSVYLKGGKRIL